MVTNNLNIYMPNIIINDDTKRSWLDSVQLPQNYQPSEDEEYMNDFQLKYFQLNLLEWRDQLITESNHTLESLKNKSMREPDDSDRAFSESDTNIELRTRERYLKLISKIDNALEKIEAKTYGYCEETEDVIGLKRLIARPIASLTVEAQERREKKEKLMHETESE